MYIFNYTLGCVTRRKKAKTSTHFNSNHRLVWPGSAWPQTKQTEDILGWHKAEEGEEDSFFIEKLEYIYIQ